ncbi:hypothetical protein [Escherichia coli]
MATYGGQFTLTLIRAMAFAIRIVAIAVLVWAIRWW